MDILRIVGEQIVHIMIILLDVYTYIIFARIIMSWFVPRDSTIFQFAAFITDPVLEPIRKLLRPLMAKSSIPLDFSPIIAIMIIGLIREILYALF